MPNEIGEVFSKVENDLKNSTVETALAAGAVLAGTAALTYMSRGRAPAAVTEEALCSGMKAMAPLETSVLHDVANPELLEEMSSSTRAATANPVVLQMPEWQRADAITEMAKYAESSGPPNPDLKDLAGMIQSPADLTRGLASTPEFNAWKFGAPSAPGHVELNIEPWRRTAAIGANERALTANPLVLQQPAWQRGQVIKKLAAYLRPAEGKTEEGLFTGA